MKIYLGKNKVVATDKVNSDIDIPLAYISSADTEYNISMVPEEGFKEDKENVVIPYQKFDSPEVILFDKDGAKTDITLTRSGDKYSFVPSSLISFMPVEYNYRVLARKKIKYDSNKNYNISIAIIDGSPTLDMSKQIMKIFGDAPSRGIAPHNIFINSGDMQLESLANGSLESKDIVFIETYDGIHYKEYWQPGKNYDIGQIYFKDGNRYMVLKQHTSIDLNADIQNGNLILLNDFDKTRLYTVGDRFYYNRKPYLVIKSFTAAGTVWTDCADEIANNGKKIDFDSFTKVHTSVFLIEDDDDDMCTSETNEKFEFESPCVYKDISITSNHLFTQSQDNNKVLPNDIAEVEDTIFSNINLFGDDEVQKIPVKIVRIGAEAFIIKVYNDFVDNIADNAEAMYEILMYLYSNSYILSDNINDWIADEPVDYVVCGTKIIRKEKYISNILLTKMFGMERNDFDVINVFIDHEAVKAVAVSSEYITFRKDTNGTNIKYKDPVKPNGYTSIYTADHNIVYYAGDVYAIESSAATHTKIEQNDDGVKVSLLDFRSSENGIDMYNECVQIPFYENLKLMYSSGISYVLYIKDGILGYKNVSLYTSSDGLKIGTLVIEQSTSNIKIYDTRTPGGGLAESEENYDCIDMSDMAGLQYREGGFCVITLPKVYEQYRERIEAALNDYVQSGDEIILLFKDDDN